MKLNKLIKNCNVEVYGFSAFLGLADICNKNSNSVILSTLSPAIMRDKGITVYYSPVLPRNTVFNTTQEVVDADLDVNLVTVFDAPEDLEYKNKLIVSRHKGTIDILTKMYPDATVLSGNVTPDDINDAFVVGTLPPHLIQYAKAYRAVTIKDFDYSKDGDLSGQELRDRLQINDAICVEIKEVM